MALHQPLASLGIQGVYDLGAIGRDPPPLDFEQHMGLDVLTHDSGAPAPHPGTSLLSAPGHGL